LSNTAELKKYLGPVTLLALCFNICSSWAGLSTSAQIALLQGGPVTLVYGTLVISVIYLCISLVLAELASVYPTAGGQYHFTSILAPQSITQSVSYACGFITVYQWVAMGASVLVIVATQIMALVGYFNPGAQDAAWLLFLIYQALGIITLIYNLWALRRLPQTHTLGCKSHSAQPPTP
jgi:choline transport protein